MDYARTLVIFWTFTSFRFQNLPVAFRILPKPL